MIMEKWRWVVGYEGMYMVSSRGNVMSAPRKSGRSQYSGKMLRQFPCISGYLKVTLSDSERGPVNAMVHQLVAQAFLVAPGEGLEVNHKDGNKQNNSADNLEWVTHSENMIHSYRVLGHRGTYVPHFVKLTPEQVKEIYLSEGTYADIGRRYGVSDVMVGRIKKQQSWRDVTCQLTQ